MDEDDDGDDSFSFVKAVFEEEFGGCDGDGDGDGDDDGDGVVEIKVDVVDAPGIIRRLAKDEDEEEGGGVVTATAITVTIAIIAVFFLVHRFPIDVV